MTTPEPGSKALIKHTSSNFHGGTVRYQPATVTRATKTSVFARADFKDAAERRFRADDLYEYGEKRWRADKLIVDPALIEKALADQEADRARRALEGTAVRALEDLRALFEGNKVRNRSEAEIEAIVALRDRLRIPADVNAG